MSADAENTPRGFQPGNDLNEVAESTAEALDAVHRILAVLVAEARLTETGRKSCLEDLAIIAKNVEWADPHGKRAKAP